MLPDPSQFERSVREQIAINRARTPTERMQAFWDLMDSAAALAPGGERGRMLRARSAALRERDRELMRDHFRHLLATGFAAPPPGL